MSSVSQYLYSLHGITSERVKTHAKCRVRHSRLEETLHPDPAHDAELHAAAMFDELSWTSCFPSQLHRESYLTFPLGLCATVYLVIISLVGRFLDLERIICV